MDWFFFQHPLYWRSDIAVLDSDIAYQMSDIISDVGYSFGELEAGGILSNLAPHSCALSVISVKDSRRPVLAVLLNSTGVSTPCFFSFNHRYYKITWMGNRKEVQYKVPY